MQKSRASEKLKWIPLLIMLTVMICTLLSSDQATVAQQANAADEQCIRCHVETFNAGLRQQFEHLPFFDRQCTVCHLASGSSGAGEDSSQNITGDLVSQELIWGKQLPVYNQVLTKKHFVRTPDLNSSSGYRFRLLIGHKRTESIAKGLWVGLNPNELWRLPGRELTCSTGLEGEIGDHIKSVTMTAISDNQVLFSWKTDIQLFSWVELQDLEGITLREAAPTVTDSSPGGHPSLRSPEDLAIEACYQCHPKATLGTSHPVRLYGGRNVRIPDELPTVDGMMTCVTCHDPHGGNSRMLVRTLIKTKLCVTCHYTYKNSSPSTMFRD